MNSSGHYIELFDTCPLFQYCFGIFYEKNELKAEPIEMNEPKWNIEKIIVENST